MSQILFSFPIHATPARVFEVVAQPAGLNAWWPISSSGSPGLGHRYEFDFGPGYRWKAEVTDYSTDRVIEWTMVEADEDWIGTRIRFELAPAEAGTRVEFAHLGWRDEYEHFRVSAFCWAAYLRLLRRHVEHGDIVPYEQRDSA